MRLFRRRRGTRSYSFEGKHVLITGATGGLGSELTRGLVARGARVAVTDQPEAAFDELQSGLPGGGSFLAIPADLSIQGEAEKLALTVLEELGHVDVLVNNAGIAYHALVSETVDTTTRRVFEVNALAPIILAKTLLPSMKSRGGGVIINILSCIGFIPEPTAAVYGASKAAFSSLARTLRLEVEPDGVRLLNFFPGPIATDFNENALRENERAGVFASGLDGDDPAQLARRILTRASGESGEYWLSSLSKWIALAVTMWPKLADFRLAPLRDQEVSHRAGVIPPEQRRWQLWQVESSIDCNLNCIMCPWKDERKVYAESGDMPDGVWERLRPHLGQTASVDFSGGGEPLLQPKLRERIKDAHEAGCKTGFVTSGIILDPLRIRGFVEAGLDWICFSVDAASAEDYERIRMGADFDVLCRNIAEVSRQKTDNRPLVMINFVMMQENIDQLEKLVLLADDLGVDQISFKQCDVIRGEHGKGFGLFRKEETKRIRDYRRALGRARRLARKLGIEASSFSFVPDELPVCAQDPRNSVFIRHDGQVSPCVSLAMGGETTFLGKTASMPTVVCGQLEDQDLVEIWQSETCRYYREVFERRDRVFNEGIGDRSMDDCVFTLLESLEVARKSMPAPPKGCGVCHYLYDI